jgi:sarcosine oxidase
MADSGDRGPGPRVAVVGLGAAGLAAAWSAAQRGCHVIGYDQADLDNQPASSGGRGKIIRFGYDDPFYANLMLDTLPRWEALGRQTGRTLMRRDGGLHLGEPDDVATVAGAIRSAGQPYDLVEHGDPRLDAFGIALAPGATAVYEPSAGIMDTTQTRMALAEAATAAGAVLRDHTEVTDVAPTGAGLRIRTHEGIDDFDRVIVAGGPWAFRLVPDAATAFDITRRFQLVWRTDAPLGDGRARPWMDYAGAGYYGMINVATADGGAIHIAGLHQHDREQHVADPSEPDDPTFRAASVTEVGDVVATRFGLPAQPDVVDVRACHYTSTETTDFVIDGCPGLPGAVLLSACSGHGFKFTITTGAYAAALAVDGHLPHPERFRLGLASRT